MLCAGRTSEAIERLKWLLFHQLRAGEVPFAQAHFAAPLAHNMDSRGVRLSLPAPTDYRREVWLRWSQNRECFESGDFYCKRLNGGSSLIPLSGEDIRLICESYSLEKDAKVIYAKREFLQENSAEGDDNAIGTIRE